MLRQSLAIGLMASSRDTEAGAEIERAIAASAARQNTAPIYHGLSLAARAQWRMRTGDGTGARKDLDLLDAILAKAGPAGALHKPDARQLRLLLDQGRRPAP